MLINAEKVRGKKTENKVESKQQRNNEGDASQFSVRTNKISKIRLKHTGNTKY